MLDLDPTHWSANSYCEPCKRSIYTTVPIPGDRRIGLLATHSCGEKLTYHSPDTSEFGQLIWGEISESLTFYTDHEPPYEIVLGEENA